MGLAIALETRKHPRTPLAASLPYLAAFGFLHGAVEWLDMLFLIPPDVLGISGEPALRPIKVLLLGLSTVFLVIFGARLVSSTWPRYRWVNALPVILFGLWLSTPLLIPRLLLGADIVLPAANSNCLQCHLSVVPGGSSPHPLEWVPSLSSAEVWARYLLYLPGLALTGAGLLGQANVFSKMRIPQVARDCRWAAGAFIVNTVFAGLIVSPAPYFPASVLNYSTFVSVVGVPPQVFRALMALIITVFVVKILRVFALEQGKQLDLAKQKSFEAQLGAAQELSRMKSEFVSYVSHELRTPLNAIIGFSELLLDETYGKLNPKQMRHVNNIHTSGKHLLQLVNDILDSSKVEAGKLHLNIQAIPLDDALSAAVVVGRNLGRSKSIDVDYGMPADLPRVMADPTRLNQILYNLVSNAVKFTPDKGRVAISARPVDGTAEVSIADTGIGIKPDDLEQIFVPFQQLEHGDSAEYPGTGLGLSLAKQLIELHGGRIWVNSRVGRGTTFYFTLPLERHEMKESESHGQREDTRCRG